MFNKWRSACLFIFSLHIEAKLVHPWQPGKDVKNCAQEAKNIFLPQWEASRLQWRKLEYQEMLVIHIFSSSCKEGTLYFEHLESAQDTRNEFLNIQSINTVKFSQMLWDGAL